MEGSTAALSLFASAGCGGLYRRAESLAGCAPSPRQAVEAEEGKSNVSAELEAKEADLASTRKDLSDAEATIKEANK